MGKQTEEADQLAFLEQQKCLALQKKKKKKVLVEKERVKEH